MSKKSPKKSPHIKKLVEQYYQNIQKQPHVEYADIEAYCDFVAAYIMAGGKFNDFSTLHMNINGIYVLKTKEDFVLWLALAKKSVNLIGLDKSLMFWRQIPNSLSSSIMQKLSDAYKVYYYYENKNFFYSIFYIIRLSTYALFKKINLYLSFFKLQKQ